jgi:hypothetical protein
MKRLFLAALLLVPMKASALDANISELLSVIAMPLAVAAVSDITGVPQDELANFVATLNNANVPPTQVVDLVRYVPVALVTDATQQQQPVFVDYVQSQVQQGVTGPALVPVIVQRLQTYNVQPEIITVTEPAQPVPQLQRVIVERTYAPPPVVITRVEEIRKAHPHGGPPGQLKKIEGVQTGAQIVHRQTVPPQVVVQQQPVVVQTEPHGKHEGKMPPGLAKKMPPAPPMISSAPPPQALPPGQAKKMEQGGGKGHGHDKKH